jgi:hypothetical protein
MRTRVAVAIAVVGLALASCASAPAPAKAPEWTLNTPAPDATNTYFVGWASSASGDVALATGDAAANLIANIMTFIGVTVKVDSTATARATYDSYSADVKQTVTAQATNRLAGFSVKEKYVVTDKSTGKVTVYVLASYATADLNAEKTRIRKAFEEEEAAVAVPEAEGQAFLQSGRYFDAVRKFVEAAVAASGSGITNAEIKMERNVNNARTALSKIRFVRTTTEVYKTNVGQAFAQPFRVKLVAGESDAAPGVPGAVLQVSYQRMQGTRLVSKTESAVTDGQGILSFTPPPPDFVGKAKFYARVDFQSTLDLLDRLPPKYSAYRDSLAEEFKNKMVEIPYEVVSNARSIPTAVAIVDLDDAGKPVSGALAQAGLLDALTRERFDARAMAIDPVLLAAMDEAAIMAAAKAFGGAWGRLVFGTARIESVRKDGSAFLVQARAQVRVVEIASGRTLYSAEKTSSSVGSDEQSARRSALRDLGQASIGKDLLTNLP